VAEEIRPALPLVERLGRVFTALAAGVSASVAVEVRGEIAAYDVQVLQLSALKGVFADVVEEQVTFVNAPLLAKERGIDVGLATYADSAEHRNLVTVHGVLTNGTRVSVSGTLSGPREIQKLTDVDGYDVDLRLEPHLLFFRYHDRPGIVGAVGAQLGAAGINIAGAQVSRSQRGGEALMVLSVDSAVPPALLERIGEAIGATGARSADLEGE
jgi:D-3-phosphoglycerate dehydrogenase